MINENTSMTICERAIRNMDDLLRDNTNEERLLELRRHVNDCPQCSAEARNRKLMVERLKTAFDSVEAPPYLQARIRANILATQTAGTRNAGARPRWAVAGMAAAAVFFALVLTYQLGSLRTKTFWQDAYVHSMASRVSSLMRVGLRDHIHCSVFRKFPKDAPKPVEFAEKMGPEYAGLIPIVRNHVPAEFRLVLGHRCRAYGRQFVHLSLKSDSKLLSLVVVPKQDGESFETEQMIPALVQSGIPMYREGVMNYEISSFESSGHLVYFISDLSKDENSRMMLAMAPEVKQLLQAAKI